MSNLPKPLGAHGFLKQTLFLEFWTASSRGDHHAARALSRVVSENHLMGEYFDWVEETYGKDKADQLRDTAQQMVAVLLRRA